MKQEELNKIINAHKEWLETDRKKGKYADLHGADLHGADLNGANLRGADLHGADIHGAEWYDSMSIIEEAYNLGASIDELKNIAMVSNSLDDFFRKVERILS